MNSPVTDWGKELLTIEQFAKRMQMGRSTAYGWLAAGKLVYGKHVLRIGHVVRILWSEELINHLLILSAAEADKPQCPLLKRKGSGGRNRVALDIDYLESLPPDMV